MDLKKDIEEFLESEEVSIHLPTVPIDYINDILLELDVEETGKPESGNYLTKDGTKLSLSSSHTFNEITLTKE